MFRRPPIQRCREASRSLPQPACQRCRGRPRRACRFRRCRRRRSIRRSHCTGRRSHPLRRSEPMRSCMPSRPRLTRRCRRLPTPRLPEAFRMRRCRRYPTRSCSRRSGSCPRSRRCTRRRRFQYMSQPVHSTMHCLPSEVCRSRSPTLRSPEGFRSPVRRRYRIHSFRFRDAHPPDIRSLRCLQTR